MAKSKAVAKRKSSNIEEAGEGHNTVGQFSAKRLKSFIDRIEKKESDKRDCSTDIRSIYQEAEGAGLDAKVIRIIVRERRKDKEEITLQEETKRIYKESLGDYSSTPLGDAATRKEAEDDE